MRYTYLVIALAIVLAYFRLYCQIEENDNVVWIRTSYVVTSEKILNYAEKRLDNVNERITQIWAKGPMLSDTQTIELWHAHGAKSELETLLVVFKNNDYIYEYGVIYE